MPDVDLTPDGVIHDRGRGPEIKGTRITVYDILDHHLAGRPHEWVAEFYRLSVAQVDAAVAYIGAHKPEVMAEYQKMLDRENAGNPPEIQARLDALSGRARQRLEELQRAKEVGAGGAGADGRP